jgi:hypothetical protein
LHPRLAGHLDDLASAPDWPAALRDRAGGNVATGAVWAEAMLAEPRFAMLLNVRAGSPLLSLWWVEKAARSALACSQMLQQGSAAAMIVSEG